jgi:hypothetical protein
MLFLLDGLGAVLTTVFLFFILRKFHEYVGMPINILIFLSYLGLLFCIFSGVCFFFLTTNWTPFLRIISIANTCRVVGKTHKRRQGSLSQ